MTSNVNAKESMNLVAKSDLWMNKVIMNDCHHRYSINLFIYLFIFNHHFINSFELFWWACIIQHVRGTDNSWLTQTWKPRLIGISVSFGLIDFQDDWDLDVAGCAVWYLVCNISQRFNDHHELLLFLYYTTHNNHQKNIRNNQTTNLRINTPDSPPWIETIYTPRGTP